MKLKKLLISASAIAASGSLLGVVLSSCSKSKIDDDLKIKLDDNGNLTKKYGENQLTYKDIIKQALSKSSNWDAFKNALANEIVYKWYVDRASKSKSDTSKNVSFRINLDEWNHSIDKDYDNLVDKLKSKHGSNYKFYLQNEYLSPAGGSVDSYKHAKLLEKVKSDFVSKVFANSYFSYRTASKESSVYPNIFTEATVLSISQDEINNPANWDKFGFYANNHTGWSWTEMEGKIPESKEQLKEHTNFLAKNPQGDYATIQDYVFNRWFKTEKPFFSAASLFKYSNPKYVADGKLANIYDATATGVTVPDNPKEEFPFFGGNNSGVTGTRGYKKWLDDLTNGQFISSYTKDDKKYSNGTVTIDSKDTEDSQTLLLTYGSQMIGGSANALYIPYAMAQGQLLNELFSGKESADALNNHVRASTYKSGTTGWKQGLAYPTEDPLVNDDFTILSNFFFTAEAQAKEALGYTAENTTTRYLDLATIYGGLSGSGTQADPYEYHCPLFKECTTYPWLYGDMKATGSTNYGTDTNPEYYTNNSGIRFISNSFQINLGGEKAGVEGGKHYQPWILELNETGMHAQTIDGYEYIKGQTDKTDALKKVLMYRLMQKRMSIGPHQSISADLFGDSGKLKTYFNDNFADIVLEIAMLENDDHNVFRNISDYSNEVKAENLFLSFLNKEEKLGAYANLTKYLTDIISYSVFKKEYDAKVTANEKIFAYRSKQVANAKKYAPDKAIFANGLLAPIAYYSIDNDNDRWTYDYNNVNSVTTYWFDQKTDLGTDGYKAYLNKLLKAIPTDAFITEAANAAINADNGFSPQISAAKKVDSNRAWYKSALVDKFMYGVMGDKQQTSNSIKVNTYLDYINKKQSGLSDQFFGQDEKTPFASNAIAEAFASTYAKSKLITGDKNLATYVDRTTATDTGFNYFDTLNTQLWYNINDKVLSVGDWCDEIENYQLLRATMIYLAANDFENFYKTLDSKIAEDDMAVVGYVTKNVTADAQGNVTGYTNDDFKAGDLTDYNFNANVDNIFDDTGYAGQGTVIRTDESLQSIDNYWNLVNKFGTEQTETQPLAGFTGLQTSTNNSLNSESGLKDAVFGSDNSNLAIHTNGSNKLVAGATEQETYAFNEGCWFRFAGSVDNNGKPLTFKDVTYTSTEGKTTTIKADDFKEIPLALRLAKKIAEYDSMDDLRSLATTLDKSHDGTSGFSTFRTQTFASTEEMKVGMLQVLLDMKAGTTGAEKYSNFNRLTNVELHAKENADSNYCFEDVASNTKYRMMLTQISKADITEKKVVGDKPVHTFSPTWNAQTKAWEQGTCPITLEEFFNIFMSTATDSAVQQLAVADAVKAVFGNDKLIVYDAQIYNSFDSVWIKDWVKKPMGA